MTVQRVRPAWDREDLLKIYATPHDHTLYGAGHHLRVEFTKLLLAERKWSSVADLSCGNGNIARSLKLPDKNLHLGDFAQGYRLQGPIEKTIEFIPGVDGFILSETMEHLDDPGAVLQLIREKSRELAVTTPLESWGDTNGEHYWAWDREGVETLAEAAGWKPEMFATLDSRVWGESYLYGMWVFS